MQQRDSLAPRDVFKKLKHRSIIIFVVEMSIEVCTCTLKWIFQHLISQYGKDQDGNLQPFHLALERNQHLNDVISNYRK